MLPGKLTIRLCPASSADVNYVAGSPWYRPGPLTSGNCVGWWRSAMSALPRHWLALSDCMGTVPRPDECADCLRLAETGRIHQRADGSWSLAGPEVVVVLFEESPAMETRA